MKREQYVALRKSFPSKNQESRLFIQLAQDVVLIAAIFFSPVYFAAPLIAVLMFRSFSMMHDAVHGCLSKNKALNRTCGTFYASLCLLPFEQWRAVHLDHHYWSGNFEKDSVMAIVRFYPKLPKWQKSILNFSWRAWIPALAVLQHSVFWWYCTKKLFSKRPHFSDIASYLGPAAMLTAMAYWVPLEFLAISLPFGLFAFFLMIEIVNFPHHLELPKHEGDKKFLAWEQFQTARTCIYPKWFAEKIVLNFNYHVEHHLFPDQPWYLLPDIHNKVKLELKESYNEDPQFDWILRNRRKHLETVLN